jgi:predicted SAM-dependent methyltransferase
MSNTPALIPVAPAAITLKLDLAGGQNVRDGFEGVDLWPGSKHVVNLQCYPWPFADNSVEELNCSHYIEHIPMEYIDAHGNPTTSAKGKDALFAFFDECYRILIPDGRIQVQVPCHRSDRAFQDPTHRRFITPSTFWYLSKEWRTSQKLDHYNVNCHFIGDVGHFIDSAFGLLHEEVQIRRFNSEWNLVIDWVARLQAKK